MKVGESTFQLTESVAFIPLYTSDEKIHLAWKTIQNPYRTENDRKFMWHGKLQNSITENPSRMKNPENPSRMENHTKCILSQTFFILQDATIMLRYVKTMLPMLDGFISLLVSTLGKSG